MSAYLTALALKGETIDEITASEAGMRAHCIKLLHNLAVLEIVGTGGDGSNSCLLYTSRPGCGRNTLHDSSFHSSGISVRTSYGSAAGSV